MSWSIRDNSLKNDDLLKNESIFHTANGYIGVRGNFEEGYSSDFKSVRGTYINGFYETNEISYGEKLYAFPTEQQKILNVIDAQTIELVVDGERFSLFEGKVMNFERVFNLKEGYTERTIHWRSPKGHHLMITVKRMTSFNTLELYAVNYRVKSLNYSGDIQFISHIDGDVKNHTDDNDPRVASSHAKALDVIHSDYKNDIASVACETRNSKLVTACSVYHKIDSFKSIEKDVCETGIVCNFIVEVTPGDTVSLDKLAVYTDTLRHQNPLKDGISLCRKLSKHDTDYYFNDQKTYLENFWENSDVTVEGDSGVQEGIRFNLFQLLQSAGKDKHSNIPAKGLSGEGYEGHYFWDTEIYMFPFFLITEQKIARNLLKYRHTILDGARNRAGEMGHAKGALYPWRTITGGECSAFFPAGTAQYHINADVAYSFISYYMLTGDLEFMAEYGGEVLFETSRLWCETGHFTNGNFRIDCVTGPDEYTCIVNNNYYTNSMAKHNMKWAAKIYKLLKENYPSELSKLVEKLDLDETEVSTWDKASSSMYLPYNPATDMNPQDDTFLQKAVWDFENTPKEKYPLLLNYHPLTIYRYQVCKQADTVLAHMLLEHEVEFSTMKNSYDYYEKITTHDSSLSYCIFSIMASRVGYHEKAYNYFLESIRLDLDNTHGNTKDGIHAANMGGAYLSMVYGFAGLRITEDGLKFRPTIPEGWDSYSFKVIYKNSRIKVTVTKEQNIFQLESGNPVTALVNDKVITVS